MSSPAELTHAVSDPHSDSYDPDSPHYDVTADSSSVFYVGPVDEDTARSGDEIRAEVTSQVDNDPLADALSEKERDAEIQQRYSDSISEARQGLDQGLELRPAGEPPRTVWDNATHEQMNEIISSNADSVAIAETSEEWVRLGNELSVHQQAVADAINDSMGDWIGEGGDAAREHLADVAKWLGDTAQGSVLTGRQQQIHSQTLNESQKQMAANPPVPFSAREANAALQQVTDPVAYAATARVVMQRMQEQQAAREQAARIMTQFDDTIGAAVSMPMFSPPPKLQDVRARTTAAGGAAAGSAARSLSATSVPDRTGTGAAPGGAEGAGAASGAGSAAPFAANAGTGFGPDGEVLGPNGEVLGAGTNPGQGDVPGVDPSAGSDQVSVPGLPPTPGAGVSPPGLPGGSGFDTTTHTAGSTIPTTPTTPTTPTAPNPPSVRVPDLPAGGGQYGGIPGGISGGVTGGGSGAGGNVPGVGVPGFSGTSASSYTAPDSDLRSGTGKTPTLGWSGGVNGDSISSRLSGGGTGTGGGLGGVGGLGGAVPGGIGGAQRGGGGSGAAGSAGSAPRPGGVAGAGAIGDETAAGRTGQNAAGQGARGTTPGAMAPGAGGAGKRGEDDNEHRAASYLEADDDLFAAEQAIAPPVIGDWQNNKDNNWK